MWIYRLLEKKTRRPIWVFLYFVLPVIIVFLPFFIGRFDHLKTFDLQTWISLGLAGSWTFLGPYFIYGYFEAILTCKKDLISYSKSLNDIIPDHYDIPVETAVSDLYDRESRAFSKRSKLISCIWIPLVVGILLIFNRRLEDFAFWGFRDIYYWIAICYIAFLVYLTSLGFSGLLTTNRLLRNITKEQHIMEDIMEGSFQTGVMTLGSFLVRTTLYFFSGVVFFPILIVFASNQSEILSFMIIILMVVFTISVLVFFLSSYRTISKSAQKGKEALIDEFQTIYNKAMRKSLLERDGTEDIQLLMLNELRISNVYWHIEKLKEINTNPIQLSRIIVTVFTVLFPVLFFLKDLAELLAYFTPGQFT